MLDYRGIEALYTVQEMQSFEAAAKKLHITQSAVSQRIKGLENHYGEPVLIRTPPYRPTKLGQILIGHFRQMCLLEDSLATEIGPAVLRPHISIALNRDSLETWFLTLIEETDIFSHVILEILADDQELTLDYFRNGLASACVSTYAKAIPGSHATFLGNMEYVLVASPEFREKYFLKGDTKKNLLSAPAIKFDKNDLMHERYLEKFYGLDGKELHYHMMPSVKAFKSMLLLAMAIALFPRLILRRI